MKNKYNYNYIGEFLSSVGGINEKREKVRFLHPIGFVVIFFASIFVATVTAIKGIREDLITQICWW